MDHHQYNVKRISELLFQALGYPFFHPAGKLSSWFFLQFKVES